MRPINPYRPGQRRLSASRLNDQQAELAALAGMQVSGATFGKEGGVYSLVVDKDSTGFLAVLTEEGTGEHSGKYGWSELEGVGDGSLAVLEAGRSGSVDPLRNFALELSGKVSVPLGLVVWLDAATPIPSDVVGDVNHNYRFVCPDLSQVIAVEGDPGTNGYYSGMVQVFDPDSETFSDAEEVWVMGAAGAATEPTQIVGRLIATNVDDRPLYLMSAGEAGEITFNYPTEFSQASGTCTSVPTAYASVTISGPGIAGSSSGSSGSTTSQTLTGPGGTVSINTTGGTGPLLTITVP